MAFLPTQDPDCFQKRMDALLARIPHEGNRDLVRRYVRDRLVEPVKPATAFNDLNAMVDFCQFVQQKALRGEVTRDDVVEYLNVGHRQRIHRNTSCTHSGSIR